MQDSSAGNGAGYEQELRSNADGEVKGGKAAKKKVGSTINKKANQGGKQVLHPHAERHCNAELVQCYLIPAVLVIWRGQQSSRSCIDSTSLTMCHQCSGLFCICKLNTQYRQWCILCACITLRSTIVASSTAMQVYTGLSGMMCRRRRVPARVEESGAFSVELQVPSDKGSVLSQNFMAGRKQTNP